MLANAFKTILITSAVLFVASKIFLFTGIGVPPDVLYYIANDPQGASAALAYSVGFILGGLLLLLPFLVAKIRENPEAWYILALLLLVPFVGGFIVGSMGATAAAVSMNSFIDGVIVPISWVVALVWSFMNTRWITVTKTFPKDS